MSTKNSPFSMASVIAWITGTPERSTVTQSSKMLAMTSPYRHAPQTEQLEPLKRETTWWVGFQDSSRGGVPVSAPAIVLGADHLPAVDGQRAGRCQVDARLRRPLLGRLCPSLSAARAMT